jgi:centromere protein C
MSGRQHIAPLAHWRNEKVEYRKGEFGTEISGVVHVPVEPVVPYTVKRTRARSGSVKPGSSARGNGGGRGGRGGGIEHPEAGWDDMTTPLGKVIDFETGLETERRKSDSISCVFFLV